MHWRQDSHLVTKCPECSPEAVRWHVGWLFADGASGDPWEWGVVLHFSGGHQQCHTVTGEPAAEGEMSRLYIGALFTSTLIGCTALGFTCDSQRPFLVSRNVWPAFVFCRSSSRSASNVNPAEGPPPESCCSTRLCSKYRCWNSWPHIALSAISVSLHTSLVLNLSWQPSWDELLRVRLINAHTTNENLTKPKCKGIHPNL